MALPRRRLTAVLFAASLIPVSLIGCTRHHLCCHVADSIDIVATATAAEPAPHLSQAVESQIVSLAREAKAPGDAMVRIVSSATGPIIERDVTPLRGGNGEVEHAQAAKTRKIQQAVSELRRQMANLMADAPDLALLPLLDRISTLPGTQIDVESSGLQTDAPLDFRQLGWSFDVDAVIDAVVRQGLLPDLSGRHVTFFGLGITDGNHQASLPPFARATVQNLWVRLCQRAGGTCEASDTGEAGSPPLATQPVPVIPIPTSYTIGGCPVWDVLDNSSFRFAAESDVLPADADETLRPIVDAVNRCDLVLDVAGYIADTGSGSDTTNLSGRRAQAVANRLTQLGLDPRHLGAVGGRGTADPVISNFTNDQFDESKAERNRRVELSFHHIG